MSGLQSIHTAIWHEEPELDNPFAAHAVRCRGYDVFGEMLGKARWVDMLWLLFRPERPSPAAAGMLETLAVALANPGPRDASVHAAMCGGIGGAPAAAALTAALAAGAGRCGGAREVFDAMTAWTECGEDVGAWQDFPARHRGDEIDVWPVAEHVPGFDPHGASAPAPVRQLLAHLAAAGTPRLGWLHGHRQDIETAIGLPLALTGVAAAAFADLGFAPAEGETLFLLLRLPGAAAHALEQRTRGYRRFPFPEVELAGDPARRAP